MGQKLASRRVTRAQAEASGEDIPNHQLPQVPLEYWQQPADPLHKGYDDEDFHGFHGDDEDNEAFLGLPALFDDIPALVPRIAAMANSDPTDVFSFTPKHLPDFKWDGKPETYEEFARRWKLYLIVMGFKRLRTEGYTSAGADGAQVPDAAKNGDNGSANAAKKEITWAAFLSALDHKWFAASRRHEETYDVDGVLGDMKRQACCSGLESQMTKEFLAMTQQPGEDLTTFHNRLTVKADLCGFN